MYPPPEKALTEHQAISIAHIVIAIRVKKVAFIIGKRLPQATHIQCIDRMLFFQSFRKRILDQIHFRRNMWQIEMHLALDIERMRIRRIGQALPHNSADIALGFNRIPRQTNPIFCRTAQPAVVGQVAVDR